MTNKTKLERGFQATKRLQKSRKKTCQDCQRKECVCGRHEHHEEDEINDCILIEQQDGSFRPALIDPATMCRVIPYIKPDQQKFKCELADGSFVHVEYDEANDCWVIPYKEVTIDTVEVPIQSICYTTESGQEIPVLPNNGKIVIPFQSTSVEFPEVEFPEFKLRCENADGTWVDVPVKDNCFEIPYKAPIIPEAAIQSVCRVRADGSIDDLVPVDGKLRIPYEAPVFPEHEAAVQSICAIDQYGQLQELESHANGKITIPYYDRPVASGSDDVNVNLVNGKYVVTISHPDIDIPDVPVRSLCCLDRDGNEINVPVTDGKAQIPYKPERVISARCQNADGSFFEIQPDLNGVLTIPFKEPEFTDSTRPSICFNGGDQAFADNNNKITFGFQIKCETREGTYDHAEWDEANNCYVIPYKEPAPIVFPEFPEIPVQAIKCEDADGSIDSLVPDANGCVTIPYKSPNIPNPSEPVVQGIECELADGDIDSLVPDANGIVRIPYKTPVFPDGVDPSIECCNTGLNVQLIGSTLSVSVEQTSGSTVTDLVDLSGLGGASSVECCNTGLNASLVGSTLTLSVQQTDGSTVSDTVDLSSLGGAASVECCNTGINFTLNGTTLFGSVTQSDGITVSDSIDLSSLAGADGTQISCNTVNGVTTIYGDGVALCSISGGTSSVEVGGGTVTTNANGSVSFFLTDTAGNSTSVTIPAECCNTGLDLSISGTTLTSSVTQTNGATVTDSVDLSGLGNAYCLTSGTHSISGQILTTTINQENCTPISFSTTLPTSTGNGTVECCNESLTLSADVNNKTISATVNQSVGASVADTLDLSPLLASLLEMETVVDDCNTYQVMRWCGNVIGEPIPIFTPKTDCKCILIPVGFSGAVTITLDQAGTTQSVDWGDGATSSGPSGTALNHTYSSSNTSRILTLCNENPCNGVIYTITKTGLPADAECGCCDC